MTSYKRKQSEDPKILTSKTGEWLPTVVCMKNAETVTPTETLDVALHPTAECRVAGQRARGSHWPGSRSAGRTPPASAESRHRRSPTAMTAAVGIRRTWPLSIQPLMLPSTTSPRRLRPLVQRRAGPEGPRPIASPSACGPTRRAHTAQRARCAPSLALAPPTVDALAVPQAHVPCLAGASFARRVRFPPDAIIPVSVAVPEGKFVRRCAAVDRTWRVGWRVRLRGSKGRTHLLARRPPVH